jgi:hypothetical protein
LLPLFVLPRAAAAEEDEDAEAEEAAAPVVAACVTAGGVEVWVTITVRTPVFPLLPADADWVTTEVTSIVDGARLLPVSVTTCAAVELAAAAVVLVGGV